MASRSSLLTAMREALGSPAAGRRLSWAAAVATALALAGVSLLEDARFPLVELPKGSTAPYTIRATHDAVYDLHETFRAEAEEARLTYVPIYNFDERLPFDRQEAIIKEAMAEPLSVWKFPAGTAPEEQGSSVRLDAGPTSDAGREPSRPGARSDADAGAGRADQGLGDAGAAFSEPEANLDERRREVGTMLRGCFRLLEVFYRDGVVGDNEFPKAKKTVRIFFREEYYLKPVADLHRFSSLRPELERGGAHFFFKTDARVREQVVNYILQRIPPNLTYAKENDRFIGDISQVTGVKVVLIRGGEVLVRRGEVVDTRAYYAIRASVLAAGESSRTATRASRFSLLLGLMLLLVIATREISPTPFRNLGTYLVLFGGLVLLVVGGKLLLAYLPVHPALVPQAALAVVVAVVMGRAPGLLAGFIVPACFLLTQTFDLTTLLVGAAGGITGALTVRRRRRGSALAAGVLIGVMQSLIFEATRVLEGRPRTYAELWSAGQAFLGGILSGGLALASLPLVERLLGKSSRGKLRVLADFDHPLVRELRERAPGTFAHTITVMNMVELAVESIGGERLLARVGTLYHDIGKMMDPLRFLENLHAGSPLAQGSSPEEQARAALAHVAEGLVLARKYQLPKDVVSFIAEHHGSSRLEELRRQSREAGGVADPASFRHAGPKPQSLETAVLMIADGVHVATRTLSNPDPEALEQVVDSVIFKGLSEFQFEECGLNQGHLRQIKEALVGYLTGKLNRPVVGTTASETAP